MSLNSDQLQWHKMSHLLPVIVQDANTGKVLMLGYMNEEALKQTIEKQQVIFFSRAKQRLWTKGETSGHFLSLVKIIPDCDGDALLILALPQGPTCHFETESCFNDASFKMSLISDMENIIEKRKRSADDSSYVHRLLKAGINRIAQKVGEEAVETAIAAVAETDKALCEEMADLFFHMQVLLSAKGLRFIDILQVLQGRVVADHAESELVCAG